MISKITSWCSTARNIYMSQRNENFIYLDIKEMSMILTYLNATYLKLHISTVCLFLFSFLFFSFKLLSISFVSTFWHEILVLHSSQHKIDHSKKHGILLIWPYENQKWVKWLQKPDFFSDTHCLWRMYQTEEMTI